MTPNLFFSELWREFVHNLEGRTYITTMEMDIFFDKIYPNAIKLFKSRHFAVLTEKDRNWIENESKKVKNQTKERILEKAETENILIKHKNEWVIHLENAALEKKGTTWEIVEHSWNKTTGF